MSICKCHTAGVQLVKMGYFPCAPIHPTLAFDMNFLEFVTIALHNMVPNMTGWSGTLQYFLNIHRYLVGEKVHAFLTRVLYGTEESFRTRSGSVSGMHYIGIKFSLLSQTRKSIHGFEMQVLLRRRPLKTTTSQIAPVASKAARLYQSLWGGQLRHSV